jgi:hypothetical protein
MGRRKDQDFPLILAYNYTLVQYAPLGLESRHADRVP